MPLQGPGHFKENVKTLMGEIGKSPHVQSRKQALAIAYSKERSHQRGGLVGGLVDRDDDPELPRLTEGVSLEPMMDHQRDPAYAQVVAQLIEGQRRLNAMQPTQREQVRRFALGGIVKALKDGGLV